MTDRQTKVVYVSSPPFSGSTLVAFLLGTHPEIATVGEMTGLVESRDIAQYWCSCGALIRECSFWTGMEREMKAHGFDFHLDDFGMTYVLGSNRIASVLRTRTSHNRFLDAIRDALVPFWPGHLRELKSVQDRNRAFIRSALKITGKSIFLDVAKDPIRMKYLAETPGLEVKVIHLIRDVRGGANSYFKNLGWTLKAGAKNWKHTHLDIERMIRAYPVRDSMRLRYEDLCADPSTTLKEIYHFCDVDVDAGSIDFEVSNLHIIGNRMRLKKELRIRLDEKWKKELNSGQTQVVESVAGAMNRRYGY